ncbi:pheromone receptor STE3.3.1, partial [Favolaschia claudopus]
MLDALYPLFSIFSFLGFILVLIPLPWHLIQTRIPGIFFYIMWSALACLNQFVNSVVWAEDSILRAPVWCDIWDSYNIMMGASVGIPAATLCINRRLYQIASTNGSLSSNKAELRRSVLIDGLLCVFFPLVYIALQFIVQAHRFDIYEQIGCYPALYNSIPLYFLSTIWPPLISLISFAYGGLALHSSSVLTRRTTLSDSLASASITLPHYLRMLILATLSTLLTLSLGIFTIHSTATSTSTPIHPWRSLSTAPHIDSIPVLVWRSDPRLRVALEFTRWTVPVTAILFFVFSIGFAVEARTSHHHLALNSACTFLLRL